MNSPAPQSDMHDVPVPTATTATQSVLATNCESMASAREQLRQVPLFADLPDSEVDWLLENGQCLEVPAKQVFARQGDPADGFYVLLEGKIRWTKRIAGQEVQAITLEPYDMFAELILITKAPYPTTGTTLTRTRLFKLAPDTFFTLLSRSPTINQEVVRVAVERSRLHESLSQQHTKLIALGTMAAGLAHEMNNPAAAAKSALDQLAKAIARIVRTERLAWHGPARCLNPQWFVALQKVILESGRTYRNPVAPDDPLALADREAELTAWLEEHGFENAWELAPSFAEGDVDVETLAEAAEQAGPEMIQTMIDWLESVLSLLRLYYSITRSVNRLVELVQAVKSYTHMDRGAVEEIDLHEGIKSTLIMLRHKLDRAGITLEKKFDRQLPLIVAYPGDLNQVWTNLIDNAIDAVCEAHNTAPQSITAPSGPTSSLASETILTDITPADWELQDTMVCVPTGGQHGTGKIRITSHWEDPEAVVRIEDNGVGIGAEKMDRIFDPFYTTKTVGKGSGLGLDICRRIIQDRHHGSIQIQSQPGQTVVEVRLPRRLPADN